MAKAVRRQTPAQRFATLFGGLLLIALIAVLLVSFVQSSRRTVTDSPMQRVISANTAEQFFLYETARMEGDTVLISGYFGGAPDQRPQDSAEWKELADEVAAVYATALKGTAAKSVQISYHDQGELKAQVTKAVK